MVVIRITWWIFNLFSVNQLMRRLYLIGDRETLIDITKIHRKRWAIEFRGIFFSYFFIVRQWPIVIGVLNPSSSCNFYAWLFVINSSRIKNILNNNIIPFRISCVYNNTVDKFIVIIIHPSIFIKINITITFINFIAYTRTIDSNYIPVYFNCCRKYSVFLHLFCISHYLHINVAGDIIMCIYIVRVC